MWFTILAPVTTFLALLLTLTPVLGLCILATLGSKTAGLRVFALCSSFSCPPPLPRSG